MTAFFVWETKIQKNDEEKKLRQTIKQFHWNNH